MAGTKVSSAARIAANRRNAQKSTGPKTAEGKAKVRANAVKHGLTGAGIALPTEDAALVEQRFVQLQEELGPTTLEGALLIHQAALMSVRIARAALQESAALAQVVRHAATEFDLEAAAEIDHLWQTIEVNPPANHRRLMTRLAGVDRLLAALQGVRDQLESSVWRSWDDNSWKKIDACFGNDYGNWPISRVDALLGALRGDFRYVSAAEIADLPKKAARIEWARVALIQEVDAERARLIAHRAQLDPTLHAADRAEASSRALFIPTPEAILARKYEAAATRTFLRSLRDFHALTVAEVDFSAEVDPTTSTTSANEVETATTIAAEVEVVTDRPAALPLAAAEAEPDRSDKAKLLAESRAQAREKRSDKVNPTTAPSRPRVEANPNDANKANPTTPMVTTGAGAGLVYPHKSDPNGDTRLQRPLEEDQPRISFLPPEMRHAVRPSKVVPDPRR